MCSASRHGSLYAYRMYGCRCADVVVRMRAKNRRAQQPGRLLTGPRIRSPYVDEIAVERACYGDPVTLTVRERAIAVARLTARGLSAREVGRRLGLAARSVQRYRAGEIAHGREAA